MPGDTAMMIYQNDGTETNIVHTKAGDVETSGIRQGANGSYEDRGGKKTSKVLAWIGAIAITGLILTFIIDMIFRSLTD
jgi:hypothetical protein